MTKLASFLTFVLALSFSVLPGAASAADCSYLTAIATNSGPVCAGASVTVTAQTNATQPSYHWQCFQCGGPTPGVNYDTQTLTTNAFVTWEVIVTDNATGCVARAETTPHNPAAPRLHTPSSVCASAGNYAAWINNVDPADPYEKMVWTIGGGTIVSGPGTPSILIIDPDQPTYPNNGTVTYQLTATSHSGCAFSLDYETPTTILPRQPELALETPPSVCAGGTYKVTLVQGTANLYEQTWFDPTNATIVGWEGYSIYIRPNGAGPVTIGTSYTTQSEPICSRTVTKTIPSGTPPAIITGPQSATIPARSSASLTVTASGESPTFTWFEGPRGDTSHPLAVEGNALVTPPLEHTTSYWVRVTNRCGSVDSPAAVITVAASPARRRLIQH